MITLEDLNEQVQNLASQGKFQSAADIIADWAYWDMVGRYQEPPIVSKVAPLKQKTDDRKAGGSMMGQLQDRLNEEFGEGGWHA